MRLQKRDILYLGMNLVYVLRVGFNKIDRYKENGRIKLQSETYCTMGPIRGPGGGPAGVSVCTVWEHPQLSQIVLLI